MKILIAMLAVLLFSLLVGTSETKRYIGHPIHSDTFELTHIPEDFRGKTKDEVLGTTHIPTKTGLKYQMFNKEL